MTTSVRRPGALALVLHSHMPYVEGFGTWPFGEEWLWEAVACAYLPLLELLDGAPVTIGLTPVLCDQLEAMTGAAGDRYLRFLRDVRAPIHADDSAGLERGGEDELAAEVRRAAGDYTFAERAFEERGRDLVAAFRRLEGVELWTSAATHALLPLLATDAALRLQLATGTASHIERFGSWTGGLWLPECAYVPGLERELADHGARAFCVDQTRQTGFDQLTPVATQAGPVAVPIDWPTVELVWHEARGYPASGAYRDYHRRTVHDLKPWDNAGRPYDRQAALDLAAEHARDFVERALARVRDGGLLCCALDTELLGHWWYEGPAWLAAVLEEAPRRGLDLVTVADGLDRVSPVERPLDRLELGRAQGPLDLGLAGCGRARLRGQGRRAADGRRGRARRAPPPRPRARRPRAARAPGERLGLHGRPAAGRRLPRRASRRPRSRPRAGAGHGRHGGIVPRV